MSDEQTLNTPEPTKVESQPKKTLADLLKDDSPTPKVEADGNPTPGEAAGKQKKAKPKKLNELAGKHGEYELDENDLYKLEVASAKDGSPITIEQLKGLHAKQDEQTERELVFERTRTESELKLLQAEQDLSDLFELLPTNLKTEKQMNAVKARQAAKLQRATQVVMAKTPEWADEGKREAELTAIGEYMESYGVPPNLLLTLSNPGLLLLLKDAFRLKDKVDKALAQVKVKRPATISSKPNGKAPAKDSPPQRKNSGPGHKLKQLLQASGD